MAFERGNYGIEYNPRQFDKDSSGSGWVIFVVVVLAALSLSWTIVSRIRAGRAVEAEVAVASAAPEPEVVPAPAPEPRVREMIDGSARERNRPVVVRNLLMRLAEADRNRDLEMAISTIERIRALPGQPAADLDYALARRLGTLNMKRLFVKRSAQWVKKVTVKRGDSASRIAAENGSTLASFNCLNGGSVDKVILGTELYVMDHPRFNLVVRRRSRTADLSLNGKFFKRYDLDGEVTGKDGAYELPQRTRSFWKDLGIRLKAADQTELEILMPSGSPVLVSEM